MSIFKVSPSPHVQTEQSVPKLMYGVVIALLPAFAVSVFYFGIGMLIITAVSVISCIVFEYLFQKFLLKTTTTHLDGSAALTGLLLAFCLPSNLPWYMVMTGALVSIGIAKMTFGGLGNNIFNPAIVGRVFLFISFPAAMTSYPEPGQWWKYLDAVTGATPLSKMKESLANNMGLGEIMPSMPSNMDMFMGRMAGSAGEVAAFALLLGLVYMLWKKIITWHIPVSVLLSVAVFAGILNIANPEKYPPVLFQLLTGGLMLGAIFMATDYVTSPMAAKGMIIYGVGVGVITILIRAFGAYPEGVQFAILLMNGFTPLINKYVKPKRFGEVKHG
jgi:electron transport complex protein RnfD